MRKTQKSLQKRIELYRLFADNPVITPDEFERRKYRNIVDRLKRLYFAQFGEHYRK